MVYWQRTRLMTLKATHGKDDWWSLDLAHKKILPCFCWGGAAFVTRILYFIYTHSPRSDKNLLKHLRETKTFKKKRNNLKLLFLNLCKNLLLEKISMAVVNEDLKVFFLNLNTIGKRMAIFNLQFFKPPKHNATGGGLEFIYKRIIPSHKLVNCTSIYCCHSFRPTELARTELSYRK